MTYIPSQLRSIGDRLRNGEPQQLQSLAELLHWYAAERRSPHVVRSVRAGLDKLGLTTEPDFESAFINGPIEFLLSGKGMKAGPGPTGAIMKPASITLVDAALNGSDPTFRIERLESANKPPVVVAPESSLEQAITLMLEYDYSQIPVTANDRDLKGVITWQSVGCGLGLGCSSESLSAFTLPAVEIMRNRSLFSAIPIIIQNGYVLVRGPARKLCGIVTSTDLNVPFMQLSEPLLLLGEIENYIRRLIEQRLGDEEIRNAKDPLDTRRKIETAADLSFGEYVRVIEVP